MKEKKEEEKVTWKDYVSMLLYILFIICVTFFIIRFVGQRTTVSGSSMENTLSDGDNIIVDKITYRFSDPNRFDIIVFPYQYETDTYYIKRIIGLPGETVEINPMGEIYINGELLIETYGREIIRDPGTAAEPITLGEDEYFVLGDNRNNSADSRYANVGLIQRENIVGRAWVKIYPFNEMKSLTKGRK